MQHGFSLSTIWMTSGAPQSDTVTDGALAGRCVGSCVCLAGHMIALAIAAHICMQVSLPVDTASMTCFLEHYIHSLLALQRGSGARKPLPLAIMTSDDTHDATAALLQRADYFGARPRQVTLVRQGRVPCLADPGGHLALETADPYALEVKPHGHGDVHALLHQHGLARQWAADGFKWVAFFQDTNAMVFRGLLPTLGAPPLPARPPPRTGHITFA